MQKLAMGEELRLLSLGNLSGSLENSTLLPYNTIVVSLANICSQYLGYMPLWNTELTVYLCQCRFQNMSNCLPQSLNWWLYSFRKWLICSGWYIFRFCVAHLRTVSSSLILQKNWYLVWIYCVVHGRHLFCDSPNVESLGISKNWLIWKTDSLRSIGPVGVANGTQWVSENVSPILESRQRFYHVSEALFFSGLVQKPLESWARIFKQGSWHLGESHFTIRHPYLCPTA